VAINAARLVMRMRDYLALLGRSGFLDGAGYRT
jgi:hypothetical protein